MQTIEILRPVLVLAGWTVVMAIWMVATRIPAMRKAGVDAQEARDTSRLSELLPHGVQSIALNYNHLFEQPTLFYAVALIIGMLGNVDAMHVNCAWLFVGLRIVHSCVQATVDIVMLRFSIFAASWVVLATMIGRELLAAF